MIALIAFVLNVLCLGLGVDHIDRFEIVPAVPSVMDEFDWAQVDDSFVAPSQDDIEWDEFWIDSYTEHKNAFDALFNSYTYKVSKNGRSMVNGRFVKMGN